ncbi:FadR/GntR family transcriptional regulator [Nocardioides nitrophenolicus]|uniref:FadR/GntR family transcriptional regulator n=1 Tax=Nocardioides nitrophenolicus TaxID=60489 RepID=UPI00195CE7C0|nr:FCD domain-containing protein [Nocardioides nitrophenolicus]MBM7516489.1 DNA-binding FadR family transcriptional regulator [Nocardioides nitrophenolicus]
MTSLNQSAAQRPPKAAMLVAQRIVQDALRAGLGEGDLLAPEKVMLEKYQTGRGTLREALRLLEFQGVIALKPGPRGGPVLQSPSATHLGSTLVLLMQLRSAPFRTIVEVRSAVEPMISSMAANKMTDEELLELRGTVDQMRDEIDDQYSFLDANKRFHDVIAWSSGNALFGYLIESLLSIMDGTLIGIDYPQYRREAILKAHQEIYDALESRDPDVAMDRMREHIQAYERYAERKFPQVMNEIIPWEQRFFS